MDAVMIDAMLQEAVKAERERIRERLEEVLAAYNATSPRVPSLSCRVGHFDRGMIGRHSLSDFSWRRLCATIVACVEEE